MPTNTPLVSVLTTSFNREAYIAETIESVLAQTFTDFEYIIVDDCSKDRSFEIAQSYAAKDSRIRVSRNDKNLGDYPNRNKAAGYATGRYLKFIDSDDAMYPHCLDVMVRCLEICPIAGCGLSAAGLGTCRYPLVLDPIDAFKFHFTKRDLFGRSPGNAIIRRSSFHEIGGFTGLRQVGDFQLWLKLAKSFPVVVMPRDLVWCRVHVGQVQSEDSENDKRQLRINVLQEELLSPGGVLDLHEARQYIRSVKNHNLKDRLKSTASNLTRLIRWSCSSS